VVTRLGGRRSGVRIPEGARDFYLVKHVHTGSVTHPTYYSKGTGILSAVMRPGHDVNHSPVPCVEVKNEGIYTSIPLICLHGADRENFIFYHIFAPKPQLFRACHMLLTSYNFDLIFLAVFYENNFACCFVWV
jgi:hypothetical protein